MNLKSIKVNKKSIVFQASYNKASDEGENSINSTEERTVTCPEAPLPEFTKAVNNLVAPAMTFLELPDDYKNGVTIVGFSIATTKKGTRSVSIIFDKHLDVIGTTTRLVTPFVRIDKAVDGEQEKPVCAAPAKKKIAAAIAAAEAYAGGDRSQQLLDFKEEEEPEEEEDENQEEFPLEA